MPRPGISAARCLLEISRNQEAAADLAQALQLNPGHAEARFAACFAQLPVIYRDAQEIPLRRAAYEMKLRELSADVERGALTGDLIKALGARHPFLLAYQGDNDRALNRSTAIWSAACRTRFPAGTVAAAPRPRRADPRRHRAHFFRHSNWKIPIKGWLGQLDRSRFQITGYHLGATRDEQTERPPLATASSTAHSNRRLARGDPRRRAARAHLSRPADGHASLQLARSASPRCRCTRGAIRKRGPADA